MGTGRGCATGVGVDKIQVLLIRVTTPQPPPVPAAPPPDLSVVAPLDLQPPSQPVNNATAVTPTPRSGIGAGPIAGIALAISVIVGKAPPTSPPLTTALLAVGLCHRQPSVTQLLLHLARARGWTRLQSLWRAYG